MPELPDIVVYIEALEQRILDHRLERIHVSAPFLLRTAVPPIASVEGKKVLELRRLGKRIAIGFEEELWLVLHLMIAGRLHWRELTTTPAVQHPKSKFTTARGKVVSSGRSPKNRLATFDFTSGTLSLTEAGTQRRASLHVVNGELDLQRFNPGGLEIFETNVEQFANALKSENHTLKRSLTDPRLFSGIGNAYSDEILWEAKLSPIALTQKLNGEEVERLFNATRSTLSKWIEILRGERRQAVSLRARGNSPTAKGGAFPEKVTAFRPEMAVHGKYQQTCPRCGNKIQRIRYASNETNYCPVCQTAGKLLADRALSRLLRSDWPRSADELEGLTRE